MLNIQGEVKKYPVKAALRKSGEMVYFSQLDLTRILERALRRSGLPLYFTQGFKPHVKLSFYGGLKLGEEGAFDLCFYFREPVSFDELKTKLNPQLPPGLVIEKSG